MTTRPSLTNPLAQRLAGSIAAAGGWIGFDAFMHDALYLPGLGYYASDSAKIGRFPHTPHGCQRSDLPDDQAPGDAIACSDFVTAPALSPLFGRTLARQVAQALQATQTRAVWEFGPGSGALALQILQALQQMGEPLPTYTLVEVSASLRARQQALLAGFGAQVRWADSLPDTFSGVVLANEVLDAMPVKLLARRGGVWHERGVACDASAPPGSDAWVWQDRPTPLRPPVEIGGTDDYLTEIHPQAEAFVRTLGDRLTRGAVFLIDYGFPEAEYYHPQRHMGTLMCHRAHRADDDPLQAVGLKDITAHVNFTGIALAANEAGLDVLGYCNQARFLMNCGLLDLMVAADRPARAMAHKLVAEHEMGELFKVIGLCKSCHFDALGFAVGDKTHTL